MAAGRHCTSSSATALVQFGGKLAQHSSAANDLIPPPPNFRALLPTFHTTDTLIFSLEILDIHLDSEQVSNLIQRLIHTDDAGKGPRCCEDWIAFVFPVS